MTEPTRARRRGVFEILADLPELVSDLIRAEIDLVRAEVIGKLRALGWGAGLLLTAAILALFVFGFLLLAATLALALVVPGWAAALIMAGFLLLVTGVVGFIGYRRLQGGIPPLPTESIASIRADLRAIKGLGDFDRIARERTTKEAP